MQILYKTNEHEKWYALAQVARERTDYENMYRANVNNSISDTELAIMNTDTIKRILIVFLWNALYKGMIAESKAREMRLSRFLIALLDINQKTLFTTIDRYQHHGEKRRKKRKARQPKKASEATEPRPRNDTSTSGAFGENQ